MAMKTRFLGCWIIERRGPNHNERRDVAGAPLERPKPLAVSAGIGYHEYIGQEPVMIQCKDCEYFHKGADGEATFSCDPFATIKEPECLQKWQLLKVNQMVASYQATLNFYRKFGPLQEKMMKMVEREMEDLDEADKWKVGDDEESDPDSEPKPRKDDWESDTPPFA
jgi:hypothetical protein